MNHQVQGLVLVNNEWVSRPLDVYQIMARAQQHDIEMREPLVKPAPHPHVPGYGVLSRTLFPSPLFKFILPANIRHKDLNDIVLVGEDSIQLNEICDHGRLRRVAARSNLNGRVLTARVFGDPREVRINTSLGSPLPKKTTLQRSRLSATEHGDQHLPPEVIVLTLTSRTLMFLWAQHSATVQSVFRHKTIKLPAGSSRFDRLGQYLAIDPKRRAIAVAAFEGRFLLYKTKSMHLWRDEFRTGADTTPIEDERIIPIEGRIMHMEFLSSSLGKDDHHVVLLFIVVHQGWTKLTCFDWDCRYDLSTATARTERVAVDLVSDDQNPSLLIPLKRSPDFLLVFDTHISAYKDVLSGAPQRTAIPIPSHILPSLHPGDSTHRPQWVQWDRTTRNPDFPKESFYIAREDGRVIVDNSEFSQSYPDVLMAGAAGNDGLLCKVGAWPTEYSYTSNYPTMNQFTYVESMPNWTPLTGLCITDLPGIRAPNERERSALFIANGVAPHGQVSELRHGLRALIDGSFSGINGCNGLWVLYTASQTVDFGGKTARQHFALMVVSVPSETLLFRFVRTQPEAHGDFTGAWDDGVWDKTISACILSECFSMQITRINAQILVAPGLALKDKIDFSTPILLAASRPGFPFFAFAFKDTGKTYLDIITVLEDGTFAKRGEVQSRHAISADPSCIEILVIDGNPHIFVGTLDSKVTLFQVSSENTLLLVFQSSLDTVSAGQSRTLCERAVVLTLDKDEVLVCTTRDGLLLSQHMPCFNAEAQTLPFGDTGRSSGTAVPTVLSEWTILRMGSTSAKIYMSSTDEAAAFVSCGSDFCQVRLSAKTSSALEIDSIWFTNRANPGYHQHSITAAYQLPYVSGTQASLERNLGGFLFVVSGDQMLYTQLDADIERPNDSSHPHHRTDSMILPRKLITGAKPTYVAYLPGPRKMLVATTEAKEEAAPPQGYRVIHSSLSLLNAHDDKPLDELEIKQEVGVELINRLVVAQYDLSHAERVYSIADWPFEDDRGKKYNLVIVGTGIRDESGKEGGRRLIFNLGQRGSKLLLQKESTYPHPVYCIAMFDRRATVSVVGKLLQFDEYDVGLGRWSNRGSIELPSPGIHISISRQNVYVSTLQHSHLCYEVTRRFGSSKIDFKQLFADSRERSCSHHLALRNDDLQRDTRVADESLVLLTDKKTATVAGLYSSGEKTFKNTAVTLFEACLPRTVIRLQRGDIRPPWRKPPRFTDPSEKSTGVLIDDIFGACSDGTVYAFSILLKPACHILRLLQNIIQIKQSRDPANHFTIIKHRSGDIFNVLMNGADGAQDCAIRARDIDPRQQERGAAGARNNHIDGDVLLMFFEQGGDLGDLFSQDVDTDVPALFMELGRVLLSHRSSHLRHPHGEWTDILFGVKEWIDEVLMPLL
ncbi:mono-functional DNA-alkylating methyl methanesulfonate N-term-domain-containing protein [Boeremia exigua]|uniref:mono-functional DNA-alkylating methyl methanesulfonate N-term-domain-containing protein n=1 Tax=Boeremia exigua TaxID=749465 RepID=UPI001E8DBB16|nr:mono-functional DNA-alkylating methyl methanesulfonate N-term-domain-containing protein [Boeremia exigua]KAH6629443.1 mono-functional DNA-alkylating methyl methanesulfonate N-term-domain-containing protein [Boeremia exigua]